MTKRSTKQKRFSRDDERLFIDPNCSTELQARREAAMRSVNMSAPDSVRRDEALQRMADIKKSYEFWQELVNKNMHKKLRQRRAAEAQRAADGGSTSGLSSTVNGGSRGPQNGRSPPNFDNSVPEDCHDFFSEQDLRFLRTRLDEIVSQNGIQLQDGEVERLLESCVVEAKMNQGFDPYGIDDEEGLHGGNSGLHDPGCNGECEQDDYDVDELDDDESFSYDEHTNHHHFEVELGDGHEGAAGHEDCGPSCEFTFEYDRDGKLIPTSSNIEEKLRLMNLQSQISRDALSSAQAQASAMALAMSSAGKKKKKTQKKKKKVRGEGDHSNCNYGASTGGHVGGNMCLFCEYEELYGVKPVYYMRKQDYTHRCELERRMKIRDKLESAKSDRQARHERDSRDGEGDGASDGTVEDD